MISICLPRPGISAFVLCLSLNAWGLQAPDGECFWGCDRARTHRMARRRVLCGGHECPDVKFTILQAASLYIIKSLQRYSTIFFPPPFDRAVYHQRVVSPLYASPLFVFSTTVATTARYLDVVMQLKIFFFPADIISSRLLTFPRFQNCSFVSERSARRSVAFQSCAELFNRAPRRFWNAFHGANEARRSENGIVRG